VTTIHAQAIGEFPESILISGDTITLPEGEKIHDFQLRSEQDFYRLPDGSCLMHVIRDDTEDPGDLPYAMAYSSPSFDEIKAAEAEK